MIALKIEDLKHFTGQLFAGEAFDHWQVRDVSIVTFNTFTIDGRIRPAYYSEEERRELEAERARLHYEKVSAARYAFFTKLLGEKTYHKLKALFLKR